VEVENKKREPPDSGRSKVGWRIKTGFSIFIASMVWPLVLPILPLLGMSTQSVAKLTGIMLVAAEVLLIAAAAIAGKEGFAYIKQRVFGFIKSYGPPQKVSATRYKIGLVFFVAPLLLAFITPYLVKYIPGLIEYRIAYGITGDILLLVGLFLLGGDFWDKLQSLFSHKAKVVMPDKPEE
jgi:hypothetical protein